MYRKHKNMLEIHCHNYQQMYLKFTKETEEDRKTDETNLLSFSQLAQICSKLPQ